MNHIKWFLFISKKKLKSNSDFKTELPNTDLPLGDREDLLDSMIDGLSWLITKIFWIILVLIYIKTICFIKKKNFLLIKNRRNEVLNRKKKILPVVLVTEKWRFEISIFRTFQNFCQFFSLPPNSSYREVGCIWIKNDLNH